MRALCTQDSVPLLAFNSREALEELLARSPVLTAPSDLHDALRAVGTGNTCTLERAQS